MLDVKSSKAWENILSKVIQLLSLLQIRPSLFSSLVCKTVLAKTNLLHHTYLDKNKTKIILFCIDSLQNYLKVMFWNSNEILYFLESKAKLKFQFCHNSQVHRNNKDWLDKHIQCLKNKYLFYAGWSGWKNVICFYFSFLSVLKMLL